MTPCFPADCNPAVLALSLAYHDRAGGLGGVDE
jgi:hypothetical protein